MHGINLVDAMKNFIKEHTGELDLPTKNPEIFKAPDVHSGYLPPKVNVRERDSETTPDDYPFVLVRYLGQTDVISDSKTISIRLVIGTYSKDEQNGWRENINVFNKIELALKEVQTVGAFILTGKIEYELFEEQSRPAWHSTAVIEFEAPQLQRKRSVFEDD